MCCTTALTPDGAGQIRSVLIASYLEAFHLLELCEIEHLHLRWAGWPMDE